MRVGVAQDPLFLKHDNGPGHPERPERLTALARCIAELPFSAALIPLPAKDVSRDDLELVHDPAYLDLLEETRNRRFTVLDPDTTANEWSFAAAIRAAGAAVGAVQASVDGSILRSFVACRPPGHHAEAGRAMGFCLLNNAAVAAATAIEGGVERVAVVDWDVHHGNGTANIFYARSDVLYLSLHQHPHYPGTGAAHQVGTGAGEGYTVNIPLPAGCTNAAYAAAMQKVALPILREYSPQVIIVSAGFDVHRNDPLSGMLLDADGFSMLTHMLVQIADEHADGRIVHLLEGGYDLDGLVEGTSAVLSVLAGADPLSEDSPAPAPPRPAAINAVGAAVAHHAQYWPVSEETV